MLVDFHANIINLDHLAVDAENGNIDVDERVLLRLCYGLEFKTIAEVQVALVCFKSLARFRCFPDLTSDKGARLLIRNGKEWLAIYRQMVALRGKMHVKVGLDTVGPFVYAIPLALKSEGAGRTIEIDVVGGMIDDLGKDLPSLDSGFFESVVQLFGLCLLGSLDFIGDFGRDEESVGGQRQRCRGKKCREIHGVWL